MTEWGSAAGRPGGPGIARSIRAIAVALACFTLGACAQSGAGPLDFAASAPVTDPDASSGDATLDPAKDIQAAGKAYAKDPRSGDKAIAYARALKAVGEKRQALAVLQQASVFNGTNRALHSEYGRLALELDQVTLAQRLLEAADDPAKPDWRVISARGTVLAKQGKYREAIPLYERALALAPDQASVMNNLALAHTMEGNAGQAEALLKRAAAAGQDPRVNQNLALVLGLQGKYDEARTIAARELEPEKAAADVDYMRRIVMLEPQATSQPRASYAKSPAAAQPVLRGTTHDDPASWSPNVAAASK